MSDILVHIFFTSKSYLSGFWHVVLSGPWFFSALTLAYHIWHICLLPWGDMSRTFMIPIRCWPLLQNQIHVVFYMALCSSHSFFLWHSHTIFGKWVYHHGAMCHIPDIFLTLTFGLNISIKFHHEYVSGQDRLCSLI